MKSVLISIRPKYCELIADGKKTVEVRKTRPKIEAPFKCYIYETKRKTDVPTFVDEEGHYIYEGRGQVIGEFVCDSVYEIGVNSDDFGQWWHETVSEECDEKYMCLTWNEVSDYLGHSHGYGWHISNLVIYDKARDLSEFKPYNRTEDMCHYSHLGLAIPKCEECNECKLTRPPQSWCYVEEKE